MTITSADRDRIANKVQSIHDLITRYAVDRNLFVTGSGPLDQVSISYDVASAATGRLMLDLADLIAGGRAEDAATLRAMAAGLQKGRQITPRELASRGYLALRVAGVE